MSLQYLLSTYKIGFDTADNQRSEATGILGYWDTVKMHVRLQCAFFRPKMLIEHKKTNWTRMRFSGKRENPCEYP